ncbi:MAG TPA: Clp protease N-terminal domain-containing protein [Acidimicrobiales bacterium]|nr:Clp protease N-terminal domain-containing protein [Acidimicrobiales bacterium]
MRRLSTADVVVIAAELTGRSPEDLAGDIDLPAIGAALVASQASEDTATASATLFAELARRRPLGDSSLRLAWLSACQLAAVNGLRVGAEPSPELVALLQGIADGTHGNDGTDGIDRLADWMTASAAEDSRQEEGRVTGQVPHDNRWTRLFRERGMGMGARFTDRARNAVVLAHEEAGLLHHDFIGTEHILLGLLREGEGVAARALESLDVTLDATRRTVGEIIGPAGSGGTATARFTPRAKKVMALALREALQLGHNYIGTEHMLLGLVREGEGVAARVLEDLGAGLPAVRRRVMEVLSEHGGRTDPSEARDRLAADVSEVISSNESLEREVARLRSILRAHGISPDTGERTAWRRRRARQGGRSRAPRTPAPGALTSAPDVQDVAQKAPTRPASRRPWA